MKMLVIKSHLSFLHRLLSLPDSATSKSILILRTNGPSHSGFFPAVSTPSYRNLIFPPVKELLGSPLPSKQAWMAHIHSTLLFSVADSLTSSATHMPSLSNVVNLHSKLNGRPLPLIASFKGDIGLSRLNNFRLRLLLHCSILNKDTAAFHIHPTRSRSPLCPVCKMATEDAYHFIVDCHPLQQTRDRWLSRLGISLS